MKKIKIEVKTHDGLDLWSFEVNPIRKIIYPISYAAYADNPAPFKNPLLIYIDLTQIKESIPVSVLGALAKQVGSVVYELRGKIKY